MQATSSKLTETLSVNKAVAVQDATTARTSAYFAIAEWRRAFASAVSESADAGSTMEVQILKATSAAGAGSTAFGTAATATAPTGGGSLVATQEVNTDDIGSGYTHIAVRVTTVDGGSPAGAVRAGAVLVLGDGRFSL